MAWTFDSLIDVKASGSRVVARIALVNGATNERRAENLWFDAVPSASARNAAVTRLVANLNASDAASAGRQAVMDRVEDALARGVNPNAIVIKIQNAIDGI